MIDLTAKLGVVVSKKSKNKIFTFLDMVLGKNVAILDWEWGRNLAPREGQT